MPRTILYKKVDYCPVVRGGCGEPLEWTPRSSPPETGAESPGDPATRLQATCGSCGHEWELRPDVDAGPDRG